MNDTEYSMLARRIDQLYGIDLNCYKSTQMRRRLDAYLGRVRAENWPEYFRRLDTEPQERQRFKDYLTINVTSFFRDAEKFETLRREVLPQVQAPGAELKVWSAGCSEGPEAYTLAMILDSTDTATKARIWATDLDPVALGKAKAGGPYGADCVSGVPKMLLSRYFSSGDGGYRVKPGLQRYITFQEHNLLRDPIRDRYDLIVCRNVVIYFTEEAKKVVYERFSRALRPGGVLFIGATETIQLSQARELGLEPMRVSFYRRAPESTAVAAGGRR